MAESQELRKIKKKYGEKFMHMCRELFPTILEKEGALLSILEKTFSNNSRTLYDDITEYGLQDKFKAHVYAQLDFDEEDEETLPDKTPYELLNEAGYDLYECETEDEIQEFRKYYKLDEELCTFNGGRLFRCVVFFAIKKNVDEIKRENFETPFREDEYGTSVMSIQFSRGDFCTVSIKNRYNHKVSNPDATYGNDLDRIIPGLAKSFTQLLKERGLEFNNKNRERFQLPGYVVAGDGRYYKYNLEIDGVYYCPGNIVINGGRVTKLENPERQILVDNFVIDLENKKIYQYNETGYKDSFTETFQDIEKIEVIRDKESKEDEKIITIKRKNSENLIEIRIDRDNQIIGYKNPEVTSLGDSFLRHNKKLKDLYIPEVRRIGHSFLFDNNAMTHLDLPYLEVVNNYFLSNNTALQSLSLPRATRIGDYCFVKCIALKDLSLSRVREIGDFFLRDNKKLKSLKMPELNKVADFFLTTNQEISDVDLPQLESVEKGFLGSNLKLRKLYLPKLKTAGDKFLSGNNMLEYVDLPLLEKVGMGFLHENRSLESLILPSLKMVGSTFLSRNKKLKHIELPMALRIDDYFLNENEELTELFLPKTRRFGDSCLAHNTKLKKIELPETEQVGTEFATSAQELEVVILPKLIDVGRAFLNRTKRLKYLEITLDNPKIKEFVNSVKVSSQVIRANNIAELDKDTEITESELIEAQKLVGNIRRAKDNEKNI